jgi:hypothetical protein
LQKRSSLILGGFFSQGCKLDQLKGNIENGVLWHRLKDMESESPLVLENFGLAAKLKTMNEENMQSTPEERREKLEEAAKVYMKFQNITGNIGFNKDYVFDEWLPATINMIEETPLPEEEPNV